jgi:hypothetical protein
MSKSIVESRIAATVIVLVVCTIAAGAVFALAEIAGQDRVATAAAWAMAPLTAVMGGLVAVAVLGYVLATIVTAAVMLISAARRCRRD